MIMWFHLPLILLIKIPECDLDYTALRSVDKKVTLAMNNSFGFGGTNSTLVFKKI